MRIALLVLSLSAALHAQEFRGGIQGRVTDPSGAVVANASVNVTQTATNVKRTTQSAADGKYEVRYLMPGAR